MSKVQNRSTKDDEIIAAIPAACADEKTAIEFMEKQRWGEHPACPHCGDLDVYQMKDSKTGERQANYRWRCHGCKQQFTVRVGTVFEDSRIPFKHWCYGFWRASTSKKGVSALEIHRHTGLSYKSALFLLNRIRFAMTDTLTDKLKGDVEVDEVYIGGRPRFQRFRQRKQGNKKPAVVAAVERGGRVRTKPVANVTGKTLKGFIRANVDKSARIMTDEHPSYRGIGKEFEGGHETVCHNRGEFARGNVTTNTVESFFGLFKRGLMGTYHHVSEVHLQRYCTEFDFRFTHRRTTDEERAATRPEADRREAVDVWRSS